MSNYIEITYNSAIKEAEKLESIADDIEKANSTFYSGVESLAVSWTGTSSARYQKACAQAKNEITSNVKYIRSVALALRKTARTFKEIEEAKAASKEE